MASSAEIGFTTDDEQMSLCCMCRNVVQQPVLLNCLHNCCSKCLDNIVGAGGARPIKCGACMDVTDVPHKCLNMFIVSHIEASASSNRLSHCSICAEDDCSAVPASEWCSQCQKSLCADCLPGHSKYNKQHVTVSVGELRSQSPVALASAQQQCELHAKVLVCMCLSCAAPCCVDCGLVCEKAGHKVRLLGSPESEALVARIKSDVCDLRKIIESKSVVLQGSKDLVGDLKTARVMHIYELERKKRALLDAIDRAIGGAKAAVHGYYDILDEKASELADTAKQLDGKVRHAVKYSDALVQAAGVTYLLQQQQVLLARLQHLAKELHRAQAPLDASKYVIIMSAEPERLDEHIEGWIGVPELVTDDLFCSTDHALLLEARLRSISQKGNCRQPGQGDILLSDIAHEVPDLGSASSTFQTRVMCSDIAVSTDGCRLLLAAWQHGLKEFDLTGSELSSWRPAKKTAKGGDEEVGTVEALHDGRVAVGLRYTQTVVLLRRDPDARAAWLEEKHVTELQISPWVLSVHADLVAVAECRLNAEKKLWEGGCGLVLARLCCECVLSRQCREYEIASVTVTAQALVTASWGSVKLSDGKEKRVVDACSHEGQLMWRQELDRGVTDICAAPSGRVLYMAVWESNRVAAVRAEDGKEIRGILTCRSHRLRDPARLSLNARVQGTVAAVLSYNCTTVTVYTAKR